jgi:hypothetical protein
MEFDYDHPIFNEPFTGIIVSGLSREEWLSKSRGTRIRFEVGFKGQPLPIVGDLFDKEAFRDNRLRAGRLVDVGGLPVSRGEFVVSQGEDELVIEFFNHI